MAVNVAGIRFRPTSKILPYTVGTLVLHRGDKCIAESEHGLEVATVIIPPQAMHIDPRQQALKRVVRKATTQDLERAEGYRHLAQQALAMCRRRVQEIGLSMKPLSVDFTLDGRKVVFYFTAEGRVDFRSLVKYLAGQLKTRIEMRQIGVRDEAKKLGGYGVCGRPLCCAAFLTEFTPISVKMAKEQGLALNPSRISGVCGRLKCCLAYEEPAYKAIKDPLPQVGEAYTAEDGPGKVTMMLKEAFEVRFTGSGKRLYVQLPLAEGHQNSCQPGACRARGRCRFTGRLGA